MFAPREAPLQQLAATSVPSGRQLHVVPEALLDIVDNLARAGSDGIGQLAQPGAPRRGFFAAELLPYGALTMTGNRYAYRLAVTLTRRQLAGLAGNAFAVTMRSPAHPAEACWNNGWRTCQPARAAPACGSLRKARHLHRGPRTDAGHPRARHRRCAAGSESPILRKPVP